MSSDLVVTVDGKRFRLGPTETMTFGRWAGCSLVLDPFDRGISRIAVSVVFEHGTWWVMNCSETHELHIVDAIGLSVPLAVAKAGAPASKRAVDPAGLRVQVFGERRWHDIGLEPADPDLQTAGLPPPPIDMETIEHQLRLTEGRKAVLVAMVSGYLEPFPRHNPEPLGYADIGRKLGLRETQVRRRIEAVRDLLVKSGVPGLQGKDARRPLAEWLLANRRIVPDDLAWLSDWIEPGPTSATDTIDTADTPDPPDPPDPPGA